MSFMERRSLEWIDAARSREEFEERYDDWASAYDRDLMEGWDYKLPVFIGDLCMEYVKKRGARILDAGAGTGLGGEYLYQNGYKNLFGMDMSRGMLDEARSKEIYQKLDQMVLGETLDYPDDYFDAILSVGTIGHAPPESLDEMIRITRPSGFIVFSLRTAFYDEPRFCGKLEALAEVGKWRLIEKTDPILALPGEAPDTYHFGFVYEVL
jgi:predicted TPR repeat methyltransferase